MTSVTLELSVDELAVVEKWRHNYISSGMPDTLQGAIHDMLRRIEDDMRDMESEQ